MKHAKKTPDEALNHSARQYRILSARDVAWSWDDVPDALIVELVRAYTASGDGILFGGSKSQEVGAIRVYRGREPYSVYFRKASEVGVAVERLYRYRPPRERQAKPGAVRQPEAQGVAPNSLPFHPRFTVNDLIKQRQMADERAKEWNALVDRMGAIVYGVAT